MAANSRGPPPWEDPPPGQGNYVDGSYTGPTLPPYMDTQEVCGELHLMRITGANGPLPNAPFLIRKTITQHVGGMIDGAFPEANRASYALKVRSLRQFNKLLTLRTLIDGTPVVVTEHPTLNSTRCVVSCRDVIDVPEEDLLNELRDQGVKEVRQIKRRVGNERENTPAVILTCCGTTRPGHMDFGFIRCRTRPYYPSPMQCFNCWAFGHTKLRCRSKNPICGKCSQEHAIAEDRSCSNENFCKQCNSADHSMSSRNCPQYKKENAIQRVKVDQGLSYPAARRIVEQGSNRPYANAIESANQAEFTRLNEKVDFLTTTVAKKDDEIAELRAALATRQAPPAQNNEIESLKAIVEQQAKQIQALTEQLTAFLRMVMPAGIAVMPTPVTTAITTSTPAPAQKETTKKTASETTLAKPTAVDQQEQPISTSNPEPYFEEVFEDSDVSPDVSPNRTPVKGTPRPQKPPKQQRTGGSYSVPPNKTPKRSLTAGSESLLAQQLKKVKHKSTMDGLNSGQKR